MLNVSIVIPVYNDKKNLTECVESLQKQTIKEKFEIIVVEDGSKSNLKESLKKFKNVRYFWKKNGGPASARNLGIKKSKGEFIAFIDSDCIADKNWLKNLMFELHHLERNVGIVGKIENYNNSVVSNALHILEFSWWLSKSYKQIEVAITCNSIFRKNELKGAGLFSNYKYYGEDIDLGQKLVQRYKQKIIYSPKPKIYHKTSSNLATLIKKMQLSAKGFYLTRSKYSNLRFTQIVNNRAYLPTFIILPFLSSSRAIFMALKSKYYSPISILTFAPLVLFGHFVFWASLAREIIFNKK